MRKLLLCLFIVTSLFGAVQSTDSICTDYQSILFDLVENYKMFSEEIDLQLTYSMAIFNSSSGDIKENARIEILRWVEHKMLLLTLMEGAYPVYVDLYPDKGKSWENEMKEMELIHKKMM